MKTSLSLFIIWMSFSFHPAMAEVSNDSDLFKAIKQMDILLFEEGFNQCNLALLKDITHENLNFYHDIGGQQNKAEFLQATKENICGQTNQKITRQLVSESMVVHQLMNNNQLYGAIQHGTHEFFIEKPGEANHITGKALFTHVWVLVEGKWQLIESLSYKHEAADVSQNSKLLGEKFDVKFSKKLFDRDILTLRTM